MLDETHRILPQQFLAILDQLFPDPAINDRVVQSYATKRPLAFRINTIKDERSSILQRIKELGVRCKGVDWYQDAYILELGQEQALLDSDVYKDGCIYIQNLSSMIPVLLLDPKPEDLVCDLAAAPGSKTSQIAAFMHNQGVLIANDRSRERRYKLDAVLKQQGVTNAKTTTLDGKAIWKIYPEYFDKMLVDAPCSLEGTFRLDDPKSYSTWSPKKVKELSQLQKHLLRSAISATQVGGTIVYSTCTLSPEENEGVIDWVLEKTNGAVVVEPITIKLENRYPAVKNWGKHTYNDQVEHCLRIVPSEAMEGFFVTKLKKVASTL